ncbi:hypothetical protein CRI94_13425 [Longibacter salinarum]|uniref:DUF4252 domain-containing protein n=1 Tax=Longibacter salinarum TaxID=1850348 RepID=A0A2A8CV05_9BACT|nr:YbjN domain-containing protein [Longibacter salinarum]PEN12522.1 hypothetical protein CRI94_13425 [Longibacter salinarum]
MRTLLLAVVLSLAVFPASAQIGSSSSSASYDTRVKKALDAEDWNYEIDDDGDFKMVVGFEEEDRSQLVWVISNTLENQGLEIREVWSPVYKSETSTLPDEIAQWAIEASWDMVVGSLAADGSGTVYFVAKIDAEASSEVLSKMIRIAAGAGDELEKQKSPGDEL